MPEPYPAICANGRIDGSCPFTPSYENRECTSGAAFWGSGVLGRLWPTGWGNGQFWPAKARALGWLITGEPAVNTIMCLAPWVNGAGPQGHVAFVVDVDRVHAEVTVWQYNGELPPHDHEFSVGVYPIAGGLYIHIPGAPPPPPPPTEDTDMVSFVIPPANALPTPVGGFATTTSFNLVAFAPVSVQVIVWKPDGTPLGAKTVLLSGNQPGVKGPVQYAGYLRSIMAAANAAYVGPLTVAFYPASAPYTVSLY